MFENPTAIIEGKRPVGRPSDYRAEYCEQVIELGRIGKSHAQIAAALDVSRQTLYDWQAVHPEFLGAIKIARDLAQAWWEDVGQNQMITPTPGFSASLFAKQVSCRFPDDYTDKSKTDITTDGKALNLSVNFVRPDNASNP